jgi:hypothetical protein
MEASDSALRGITTRWTSLDIRQARNYQETSRLEAVKKLISEAMHPGD